MESAPATFILAVPGSDQTRQLSHYDLLRELSTGQITPEYWVWSAADGDWKQISEWPELRPPVALPAPAAPPPLVVSPAPLPRMTVNPYPQPQASPAAAFPKEVPGFVAPTAVPIGQTVVYTEPAASTKKKKRVVQPRRSERVEEDEGISFVQIVFGALYLAVAGIILANYLLVDEVLDQALDRTSFVLVPTHAHLGSFVQPNALVILVLPNSELTAANLADYLQAVAKCTPGQPFNHMPFLGVALTSSGFSQYALTGDDWKSLAKMGEVKPEERKDFITDHLCTVAGQPLISHPATMSDDNLKTARDRVWQDFVARFVQKSNG